MKWFQECSTLNDAKKRYYELVKQYHPDKGGDTATMQEINNAYTFVCAKLARGEQNATAEDINTSIEEAEAYREAINAVINLDGILIEIVGAWIWLTGETRQHKDTIKAAGYWYASKKQAWYFRTDEYKVRSKRHYSLDQIRAKYGSKTINRKSYSSIED